MEVYNYDRKIENLHFTICIDLCSIYNKIYILLIYGLLLRKFSKICLFASLLALNTVNCYYVFR